MGELTTKAITTTQDVLNQILADSFALYVKTLNYHWNVQGHEFYQAHQLFEKQYTELAGSIDEIAEKVRSNGGTALGSMKEFVAKSRLEEKPGKVDDFQTMVADLYATQAQFCSLLRDDAVAVEDDPVVEDFIIGLLHTHQKMVWMLKSSME